MGRTSRGQTAERFGSTKNEMRQADVTVSTNPLSHAWDAWRATRGGPAAIEERRRVRLAALVAFARSHSRYYAELYRGIPPNGVDLGEIPPVTKGELMARFDDWVTDPAVTRADVEAFSADPSRIGELYLGRYVVWHTSGSSGVPVLLIQDRGAMAVYAALEILRAARRWLTWRAFRAILRRGAAGVVVAGGHFTVTVLMERRNRTRPWRKGRTLVLDALAPLEELVRALNARQPALVGGYATVLTLLGHEQEAGRLRINPVLLISSAETLPAAMRARLEEVFGCAVREAYSAAEALTLAYSCEYGWLHVNADWMILEPVDRSYRPTPPGHLSDSVLITNLANRIQPILRYDLNDRVLVNPARCRCGSPLPAVTVEGRTDEILSFPAPDGRMVHLLPMALYATGRTTPGVRRHQLIQTASDRLTVRLETVPTEDDGAVWVALHERLRAYLTTQGLLTVTVERAAEPPASDPRSGKFRRVWSAVRP